MKMPTHCFFLVLNCSLAIIFGIAVIYKFVKYLKAPVDTLESRENVAHGLNISNCSTTLMLVIWIVAAIIISNGSDGSENAFQALQANLDLEDKKLSEKDRIEKHKLELTNLW